jgi:FKBP-type peptidyl-prolyl cis-trans isomerase
LRISKSSFIGFWLIFTLVSCRGEKKYDEPEKAWSKEHSVDFNTEINEREQLQINTFLEHYSFLKMKTSNSGLRYSIYEENENEKCKKGDVVKIKVTVRTLDMNLCYKTDSIVGFEEVLLGRNELESGIQEMLSMMRFGEKARCILPSYLGHGLIGDKYTIPPQAILYVDLEIKQ